MKQIDQYIIEKFKISSKTIHNKKYSCKLKDKEELQNILKERLNQNKDADLNDIDVSEITDMSSLFANIFYLDPTNINISEWNVSNVTNMYNMFGKCFKFNCDLSNWDVSNVTNMKMLFLGCKKFKGEGLDNWDIRNVKNMDYIFNGTNIKKLPKWYKQ